MDLLSMGWVKVVSLSWSASSDRLRFSYDINVEDRNISQSPCFNYFTTRYMDTNNEDFEYSPSAITLLRIMNSLNIWFVQWNSAHHVLYLDMNIYVDYSAIASFPLCPLAHLIGHYGQRWINLVLVVVLFRFAERVHKLVKVNASITIDVHLLYHVLDWKVRLTRNYPHYPHCPTHCTLLTLILVQVLAKTLQHRPQVTCGDVAPVVFIEHSECIA